MNILHVVGARPNFMKLAPVLRAFGARSHLEQTVIHTGQHYDVSMSDVFFQQLEIPPSDINLGVGSGSHAKQTAEIMIRIEPHLLERRPDWTVVYGDVNSTLATALVCSKLGLRLAHVEAGLRSFDRAMPEEINRLVTDQLADVLFTPSEDGDENLQREGISPQKIYRVGNVMIDSLIRLLPLAQKVDHGDMPERYALVTLHRPSNVDDAAALNEILSLLLEVNRDLTIVFPVHPRTRQRVSDFGLDSIRLKFLDPLPYVEFLALQMRATVVITDSGGIQEETTYLGIPCLTMRENTERPLTVALGTNTLIGRDRRKLMAEVSKVLAGEGKRGMIPPLWDGKTGERIAEILLARASTQESIPSADPLRA